MDHASFMSKMLRPTYVWRMARGIVPFTGAREDHPLVRSARTRMANAQRQVDDLVLARAEAIQAERRDARRCAAMSRTDTPVRCEAGVNHGPLKRVVVLDGKPVGKSWDHAARSQGTYWMER